MVKQLIAKCHKVLQEHVYNKEEFTTRVSYLLQSNDPQSRIISLKLFSYLPSFIQTRLDIQHKILHILTSTQNSQEREVANQTITMISRGSEIFAQSIMSKVQETVLSGSFSQETCSHFITAISHVSGDARNALMFFETIENLYDRVYPLYGNELDSSLMMSLIKMTVKAPVILYKSLEFLLAIECYEGIELISRKFGVNREFLNRVLEEQQELSDRDKLYKIKICINQELKQINSSEISQIYEKIFKSIDTEYLKKDITSNLTNDFISKVQQNQLMKLCEYDQNLLIDLTQRQLRKIYNFYIESKNQQNSTILETLESMINFNALEYDAVSIKSTYYLIQGNSQFQDQALSILIQIIENHQKFEESKLFIITLRNFLKTIKEKLDFNIVINALFSQGLQYEVFTIVIPMMCDKQSYSDLISDTLDKTLKTFTNKSAITYQQVQICLNYAKFTKDYLNQLKSLDELLFDIQELQFQSVALYSKWEFQGRELFEQRDIIQNDSTNEPYKYFFIYQYFSLLTQILEYKQVKLMLEINDISDQDLIQDQLKTLTQQIKFIEKTNAIQLIDGSIDDLSIDRLMKIVQKRVFLAWVPLFMNIQIVIEDLSKVLQDEIQVKKEQDYIAKIKLQMSDSGKLIKKQVQYSILSICLIQNHAQYFHVQSSDIISQSQRVIKTKDKIQTEILQLKFPTIGQYVLRLETRIVDKNEKLIGAETTKNIRFRVL